MVRVKCMDAPRPRKDTCASASRIGILMLNSPNIPTYAHHAALINYMYAARHGYGFMVMACPDVRDMKKDWMWDGANEYLFVWSKARMLAHALTLFDIVLYIDSDAVVWDPSVTIESKVRQFMSSPKTCMVMAQDCKSSGVCYAADKVNAGVVLLRRSAKTSQILEHWMDPDKDCAEWKDRHPREQMCIEILRANHYGENIKKVPVQEMNGSDGTWIRHYMMTPQADRDRLIDQHLQASVRAVLPPQPRIPTAVWAAFMALALAGLAVLTMRRGWPCRRG